MSALASITSSRDFRRVYRTGTRVRSDGVTLWVVSHGESGPARLGMSVRARAGNAVARNRFRRRTREIMRSTLPPGTEVVVHGDASATGKNFQELTDCLDAALTRAGVTR